MDSRTDIDDEHFFGSYEAERAAVDSAHEPEDAEPRPPSPEQLAHLNRFRKPVAWAVAGLTLFSLLALEEHGAQREYVAHLSASLPAPEPVAPTAALPEEPADATTLLGEISIQADSPDSEAVLEHSSAEFLSELTSMCWTNVDCGCALNRESHAVGFTGPLVFDSCLAHEQASLLGRTYATATSVERTLAVPSAAKPVVSSPFDEFLESIAATLNEKPR
ncbi:MAG TPA: hypothetical protein VER11_14305 [Polyangiaceae bacterium]|nr:hypothetical protein [Polyangiaceae bacterium]